MSYENAPATILLATHCCCCGKALVDAISVEMGIGPECRRGETDGISDEQRTLCNRLTYQAALASQKGNVEVVRKCAEAIKALGLETLADKVGKRFVNADRLAKIKVTESNGLLTVVTPFKRSMGAEFVNAWRNIQGRRYDRQSNGNIVPVASKGQLWDLLKTYFPGEFGTGPQGTFRVPGEKKKKAA